MLALDVKSTYAINLDQNARMTANGCSVQSNSKDQKSISARQYSLLTAERICSSGGYEGRTGSNVTPQPLTDCPQIPDPLAKRTPPQVGICDYGSLNPPTPYAVSAKTRTLSPGTYCGGLTITDGSNVTLGQGTYVIKDGPLIVEKGSTLAGEYVGFYLTGNAATFRFDFDTTVSLSAPKTGAMAGLLFFGDPNNNTGSAYRILSDNARKLLGTIYLPAGQLLVDANKPIADQSAYTVIVARTIQLNSGPNLVLNANYGSTDVPVPQGVGPLDNKITLSQ